MVKIKISKNFKWLEILQRLKYLIELSSFLNVKNVMLNFLWVVNLRVKDYAKTVLPKQLKKKKCQLNKLKMFPAVQLDLINVNFVKGN